MHVHRFNDVKMPVYSSLNLLFYSLFWETTENVIVSIFEYDLSSHKAHAVLNGIVVRHFGLPLNCFFFQM